MPKPLSQLGDLRGLGERVRALEAENVALRARIEELAGIITAVRDDARRRMIADNAPAPTRGATDT